ncbi:MAG: hypothetical protein ACE5HO_03640, partial [bacterium]
MAKQIIWLRPKAPPGHTDTFAQQTNDGRPKKQYFNKHGADMTLLDYGIVVVYILAMVFVGLILQRK